MRRLVIDLCRLSLSCRDSGLHGPLSRLRTGEALLYRGRHLREIHTLEIERTLMSNALALRSQIREQYATLRDQFMTLPDEVEKPGTNDQSAASKVDPRYKPRPTGPQDRLV